MKTDSTKVIISIDSQEQQESVVNSRKTLRGLQYDAENKENLVGRSSRTFLKESIKLGSSSEPTEKNEIKRKKPTMVSKAVQTGEITANDLTSVDEPGLDYWKKLAEKRLEALNTSFEDNDKLREQVEVLQEENRICKEMLDEAKHLVEVLNEMVDSNGETEPEPNTTENLDF